MAFGMIEGCIDLMEQVKPRLGHVNRHRPVQPGHFAERLADLKAEVHALAQTPHDPSREHFTRVIRARLAAGEAAVAANTEAAIAAQAFGSPTYVLDGERFWGQDRLEDLARTLGR